LSSSDEASNQCLSQKKKKQKIKSEQLEHDMENRKRIAWARVSAAKVLQVTSSKVAFRLGWIEELTKTIELLDMMRLVIGESVYMTRVDAVLASIPDAFLLCK
jgi:hypothetical protein